LSDSWQKLGDVAAKVVTRLYPQCFSIVLQGDLAAAVKKEAERTGTHPETIIAECVRSYLGAA
jgi:hypothetical protein